MARSMRTLFLGLALALTTGAAATAAVGNLTVSVNDNQRISLAGSAANVIVANPNVADVTMISSHSLLVIGHLAGRTHVMALDARGGVLLDAYVTVAPPDLGQVTVYRGPDSTYYACTTECAANPLAGPTQMMAAATGAATSAPATH